MNPRALAAIGLLVTGLPVAPLTAPAATGPVTNYDLTTRETATMRPGEYDGRLRLQITSDGIVSGTFMTTEGELSDVVGGLNGDKIWLQFERGTIPSHRIFSGTFAGGKLSVTAQGTGLDTWTLRGTPAAH